MCRGRSLPSVQATTIGCQQPICGTCRVVNGAFEMCVDSGYKGPLTRRTAVSVGTADHNLVPIDILSDDLDRNLVASV